MIKKDVWYDFDFLKFTDAWSLAQDAIYPEGCSMCTCEKKSIFCCFQMECPKISIKSIWSNVSFLFSGVNLVLKSPMLKYPPPIIVAASFPFYGCYHLPYIPRCSFVGYMYIYNCYIILFNWFFDHYVVSFFVSYNSLYLKSILSDVNVATPGFFWFFFSWSIIFHPLTFSLYASLGLKWISCRQHIYGSYFFIHSANLCL